VDEQLLDRPRIRAAADPLHDQEEEVMEDLCETAGPIKPWAGKPLPERYFCGLEKGHDGQHMTNADGGDERSVELLGVKVVKWT